MIPSADIQCCAKTMRQYYGRDAKFMADWAAERAQKIGDAEGYVVWRCVVKAIEELEQTKRKAAEPLN